jgi:thioredoxin-related protein
MLAPEAAAGKRHGYFLCTPFVGQSRQMRSRDLVATRGARAGVTVAAMLARTLAGLCLLLAGAGSAAGQEDGARDKDIPEVYVPLAKDFEAEAKLARAKGLPILLMVGSETCTYCEFIDKHFLKPMIISGHYKDRVLIRKLYMDSLDNIRDFAGKPVGAEDFAARFRVKLTPTVLYLGPDGEELAPRMIGISSPDYYGAYLDEHIDAATEKLRRKRS